MSKSETSSASPIAATRKQPRVIIHAEQCKGCGRCVMACPAGNLAMSRMFNRNGYRTVEVAAHRCRGCGLCYYSCPEPGAITVERGGTGESEG